MLTPDSTLKITDEIPRVVGDAIAEWQRHSEHIACGEYGVGKHPTVERTVADAVARWLDGRAVVELPDVKDSGEDFFANAGGTYVYGYANDAGERFINLPNAHYSAADAVAVAVATLAVNARLVSGSGSETLAGGEGQ